MHTLTVLKKTWKLCGGIAGEISLPRFKRPEGLWSNTRSSPLDFDLLCRRLYCGICMRQKQMTKLNKT